MTPLQPAVFVGHGNPMNAIETNVYSEAWARLAADIPRPKGILAVSAHWYVPGTWVTAMEAPRTIHDTVNAKCTKPVSQPRRNARERPACAGCSACRASATHSGASAVQANAGCPYFGKLAASKPPERSASA